MDKISWYVRKGKKTHGPFTSLQLKKLADTSKISFETPIRREKDGEWVKAQTLKGLISETPPDVASKTATEVSSRPARKETKRVACPFCAEEISAEAIKCRYCGEFLDGRQNSADSEPRQYSDNQTSLVVNKNPGTNRTRRKNKQTTRRSSQNGKNTAIGIMLTLFFGPFGMFYSTTTGALVMLLIDFLIVIPLCFVGIGLFFIPVTWIAQIVWTVIGCQE